MPAEFTEALNASIGGISLGDVLTAIITLLVCLVIIRAVMKLLKKLLSGSRMEQRVQKYVLSGIKTGLYLLTAIIVVGSLGIDMTSLVALLSVASLGITLAAEDVLANIAGGLVILSSHPFTIGDYIEASGVAGTVEEISLNYTKLVTPDGLLVMLPNKSLADAQMINYTVLGKRRVTRKIKASYTASTETVKAACFQALDMTEHVLPEPAAAVYLSDYGENAVEYTVYCWCSAAHYMSVSFALNENLRTAFADAGVEMTYPHLNVHVVENRG